MIRIALTDRQRALKLNKPALRRIARDVLAHEGISDAGISLVFIDDAEMQALNRRHLAHDYPTDVLSFLLEERDGDGCRFVEAEVIVSTDTALRDATRFGWTADAELALYVVHGLLHVCGYGDLTPREKATMRRAERAALHRHGLEPRYRGQEALKKELQNVTKDPARPLAATKIEPRNTRKTRKEEARD